MRLVARRHERRTHRAGRRLATRAQTAAHLGRAGDPAVRRVVERALMRRRARRGSVAQIRAERRGVDDLPRIEDAVRIERLLDLPERVVEHGPVHSFHEGAADETVAVLTRQRAAVLQDEIGDI